MRHHFFITGTDTGVGKTVLSALLCAALGLARRMDAERAALLDESRRFATLLRERGWDCAATESQIVPVIVGSNVEALSAAEFLQGEGFAVRAIRPPTVPAGKARLRFSLTGSVARSELDRLSSSLYEWRTRNLTPATVERG